VSRIRPSTTRAELAAIVCQALARIEDEPVLVGGAVVSIYTDGRFVSDDLDFVTWRQERRYRPLLEELGFDKRGAYWVHPDTELFLQFVNPPVMIGRRHVQKPARMSTREGELAILSPLDCVLDRLAWHLDRGDARRRWRRRWTSRSPTTCRSPRSSAGSRTRPGRPSASRRRWSACVARSTPRRRLGKNLPPGFRASDQAPARPRVSPGNRPHLTIRVSSYMFIFGVDDEP
jgi:hypothetical protein